MNLRRTLSIMGMDIDLSTNAEIVHACEAIIAAQSFIPRQRDTLQAAYKNGPLWDGDLPSKTGRDELVSQGFMEHIVVKGEDGFNACTLKGGMAYRAMRAIVADIPPPMPPAKPSDPNFIPPPQPPFVKK